MSENKLVLLHNKDYSNWSVVPLSDTPCSPVYYDKIFKNWFAEDETYLISYFSTELVAELNLYYRDVYPDIMKEYFRQLIEVMSNAELFSLFKKVSK